MSVIAHTPTNLITDPREALERPAKYLGFLGMAWICCLVLSAIVAAKIFDIGPFSFSVAVLIYPFTYIFSDIFTEVYGYRQSRRIVWTGLALMVFVSIAEWAFVQVPPGRDYTDNEAFRTIFSSAPLITAASIAAFWSGEMTNALILAKMKIWTRGRHLWLRTTTSTLGGELMDGLVFYFTAFGLTHTYPTATILNMCLSTAAFCSLYEFAATPITYKIVNFLKRAEGLDVYDHGTDFNPFRVL